MFDRKGKCACSFRVDHCAFRAVARASVLATARNVQQATDHILLAIYAEDVHKEGTLLLANLHLMAMALREAIACLTGLKGNLLSWPRACDIALIGSYVRM